MINSIAKRQFSLLALFTLQMIFTSFVQAEICRWTDENGKTHFSDQRSAQTKGVTETVILKNTR